jgi:hypothetical protein
MHAAMIYPHDTEEWILAGYVLDPLFDFGLIERKKSGEWPSVTEEDEIRITPLWRKFIGFAHGGPGESGGPGAPRTGSASGGPTAPRAGSSSSQEFHS